MSSHNQYCKCFECKRQRASRKAAFKRKLKKQYDRHYNLDKMTALEIEDVNGQLELSAN